MYELRDSNGNVVSWTEELKNAFKHGITRCRIGTRGYLITESGVIVQDNLGNNIIVTGGYDEDNKLLMAELLDYKYVDNLGFIGQATSKKLTIELQNSNYVSSMENKEFTFEIGADYNGSTYYINYGNFIVDKSPQNDVTNGKVKFTAYDYMVKFNKDYIPMGYKRPRTLAEILQYVCSQCGVELGSTAFTNSNYVCWENSLKQLEGLTYREVIKQVATLAFSWARIGQDNKLYLDFDRKLNEEDAIDTLTSNEYYVNSFKKANEYYGAINKVTLAYTNIQGLGNSAENSQDIERNGVKELVLYDNLLAYTSSIRQDILDGAAAILGLKYMPIQQMENCGLVYLKPGDFIRVIDTSNNNFYTYVLNQEITYDGAVRSNITSQSQSTNEKDYFNTKNSNTANNKPEIIVDQDSITISAKAIEEARDTAAEVSVKADEIDLKVEAMVQPNFIANSNFNTGNYNSWEERLTLSTKEVVSFLNKKWLHIVNTNTSQALPGMLQAIRKTIEPNTEYTISLLAFSTNNSKLVVDLHWLNGNTSIGYTTLTFDLTNDSTRYVETFTTPNSPIDNFTIKLQSTANTAFNYNVTEIKLEKNDHATDWTAAGADTIKSEINLSPESILISSDNISLAGKTIQMTSDNIAINSTNFSVTKDGNITAQGGTIAGINMNNAGLFSYGTGTYEGFGIWKHGVHPNDNNYIIMHAGGNTANIGDAKTRIYANGKISSNKLTIEARDSSNESLLGSPLSIDAYKNNNQLYGRLLIDNSNFAIVDKTNQKIPLMITADNTIVLGDTTFVYNITLCNPKGYMNVSAQWTPLGYLVSGLNSDNHYFLWWDSSNSKLHFIVDDQDIGNISDKRLKHELTPIEETKSSDIEKLIEAIDECKIYHYKADNRGGLISFGIVAQDLIAALEKRGVKDYTKYELLQKFQYKMTEKELYWTIDYNQYLVLKTEIQQRKMDKMQNEIDELKAQIKEIKEKLNG